MRAVEEPGATSTKLSLSGPKGVKSSHAAVPAEKSKIRKAASNTPAAPEPFFFLLLRLRGAILFLLTLLLFKTLIKPVRTLTSSIVSGVNRKAGHIFPGKEL
jgi:hypothetical protein